MGKVYLRTLADCSDNGALLAIKCGACGRLIHVSPDDLIGRKVGKGGRISGEAHLSTIEPLLVCRGGQGSVGCGGAGERGNFY